MYFEEWASFASQPTVENQIRLRLVFPEAQQRFSSFNFIMR